MLRIYLNEAIIIICEKRIYSLIIFEDMRGTSPQIADPEMCGVENAVVLVRVSICINQTHSFTHAPLFSKESEERACGWFVTAGEEQTCELPTGMRQKEITCSLSL